MDSVFEIAKGAVPRQPLLLPPVEPPQLLQELAVPCRSRHLMGDQIISYPFSVSLTHLIGSDATEGVESLTKEREILEFISTIEAQAEEYGICGHAAHYALFELLANATQYGRENKDSTSVGQVRISWEFGSNDEGPYLALAVSNPCCSLFDPSYYPSLPVTEYFELPESENGHRATITLLGMIQEDSALTYLWHTPRGEMIRVYLTPVKDPPSELLDKDLMSYFSLRAEKLSARHEPLRYDEDCFRADLESKLIVSSVTVLCILGAKKHSAEVE